MLHVRSVQLVVASALVALAGCASTARSSAPTSAIAARVTASLAPPRTAPPRAPTAPASTVTQPPAPTSAEPPSPTADTLSAMATLSALAQPTPPPTLPPTSNPATLPTVPAATTSTLLRLPLRLKADTQIEQVAISPDYASDQTILVAASDQRLYRSTDAGTSWNSQALGTIKAIAFSPSYTNDHTIFVGLLGDADAQSAPWPIQIQQSVDRGQSWHALSSPGTVPLLGGMHLFISPAYAQDHTLFTTLFGTSGLIDDPVVGDLYRSLDNGASWAHVDTPCQAHHLAISPAYQQDQTLYVGCYAVGRSSSNGLGLHRSSDNGASWQRLMGDAIADLMIAPTTPQPTLFVHGTRSSDGGATWAGPKQNIGRATTMIVSPDYASDHTLFALAWRDQNASSTQGLLRSIDGGDTWTSLIADLKTSAERPGVGIAVGRADTNKLIVLFSHSNELWRVSE